MRLRKTAAFFIVHTNGGFSEVAGGVTFYNLTFLNTFHILFHPALPRLTFRTFNPHFFVFSCF